MIALEAQRSVSLIQSFLLLFYSIRFFLSSSIPCCGGGILYAFEKKDGVTINDLHAVVASDIATHQKGHDDVHYNKVGNQLLINQVVKAIQKELK